MTDRNAPSKPADPDRDAADDLEWRLHAMLRGRADATTSHLSGPQLRARAVPAHRRLAPVLAAAAAVVAIAAGGTAIGLAGHDGGTREGPAVPAGPGTSQPSDIAPRRGTPSPSGPSAPVPTSPATRPGPPAPTAAVPMSPASTLPDLPSGASDPRWPQRSAVPTRRR